jgi:GntR family transcriptional regulator
MKIEVAQSAPGHAREVAERSARTPRYEEIYRQLVGDIREGRYPVGGKLPPERELCATFGASRHTVRDAVRRLTEQGLIARRAGAGTVVLRRTRGRGFTQQISAIPDLLAYVKNARLEVLAARNVKASAQEAALLRCRRGQAWHRLDALKHLRTARKPVAYVLAFVHRDHPALRGVLDRRGVALHDFIEERIGERIVTVEQELSAKPITGKEAEALKVAPGFAGFVIARRYLSERGTVVLVTSTIFPYDLMRYSMALKLA